MKKHNLYFEIKKNLVFSQLSFLSKFCYALRMRDSQTIINFEINNLKTSIELQARFWTFVGIVTLTFVIIMSLILILIVAGIGNFVSNLPDFPSGN